MQVLHEAKGQAKELDATCIVPAFGNGMCPKLVGEVKSARQDIRVNALKVLCDELKNPMSVVGCVQAGVVPVLNTQAHLDPDPLTRQRASKALEICARDATGQAAMLDCQTASAVSKALDDTEDEVRRNVYEALIRLSTSNFQGVKALIEANYAGVLVGKAANEVVALQPLALKLLRNCLRDDEGLQDALGMSAVDTCISLLNSADMVVRCEAANTLATLCFAEVAKIAAIEGNAVAALMPLLKDEKQNVRAAAAGALMTITTTDEGKRRMVPEEPGEEIESVVSLVSLLREGHNLLATNVLKCIANVAVHPRARAQMRTSKECLSLLDQLCDSPNTLISKHAAIAKNSVLWEP
mmetsp:Transcript_1082/g.3199  ORF Transcript_1082/g.3199 Transcript_1082/m.3199 type:complete len:354 (-) Transcript_1082:225-1286(-)|eukprot:CAMPEP_0197409770 /NCGR_PEP_ID=MMETSP1165-20131217/30361_1 /TAXON_ID=284809 /ORGANISM="Chrysocystis fragilis, Strain CCMP3189" /LENGTH=353 /DNA_ID=CAMNT_0042936253 /DNA_START=37 /DNA_END=1098 /DNA_ORIENTATION=+